MNSPPLIWSFTYVWTRTSSDILHKNSWDHTVTMARHGRQVFREDMKNYQKPLVMHQSDGGWERGRRRRNCQYGRRKSKEYLVMFIMGQQRRGRLTLSSRGEMLFPCAEQIQLLNIINWFLIGLRQLGWISDGGSLRMKIEMGPRHKLDKSFQCLQWAEIKTRQIFLLDDHCVVLNHPRGIFTITLPHYHFQ